MDIYAWLLLAIALGLWAPWLLAVPMGLWWWWREPAPGSRLADDYGAWIETGDGAPGARGRSGEILPFGPRAPWEIRAVTRGLSEGDDVPQDVRIPLFRDGGARRGFPIELERGQHTLHLSTEQNAHGDQRVVGVHVGGGGEFVALVTSYRLEIGENLLFDTAAFVVGDELERAEPSFSLCAHPVMGRAETLFAVIDVRVTTERAVLEASAVVSRPAGRPAFVAV